MTNKRLKKRVDVGDAKAVFNYACCYFEGEPGFPRDLSKAFELWHEAGELGDSRGYHNIAHSYLNGTGVQQDTKKARHYLGLAAIRGDNFARANLGVLEERSLCLNRAVKHYTIAIMNQGCRLSYVT